MTSEVQTAMILIRGVLCIVVLVLIVKYCKIRYPEVRKKLEEARREAKRNN